ncbi:hypothetical protein glysoja_012549 [Glycine soja]|nr:hypothetical protein glysoja_012549 [Glycine soja]
MILLLTPCGLSKRGLVSMSVRFQVVVGTSFSVNFIVAIVQSGTKMFYLDSGEWFIHHGNGNGNYPK